MKWRVPADRKVVEAVVATFRGPVEFAGELLAGLRQSQWERSYFWIDASGMALYFLERVKALGFEALLPEEVLMRLETNMTQSRQRTAAMWGEFVAINKAFMGAGACYANLKGFTLTPDWCREPALRTMLDLDFLVDGKDLEVCREVLGRMGYVLRGTTGRVWEFKTGCDELARIEDHYKPRVQRCVELHFAPAEFGDRGPARDRRLDRLRLQTRDGITFPALNTADQIIGHATHLLGHLCGPTTRLAWLLEFATYFARHCGEKVIWDELYEQARENPRVAIALGVTLLLCKRVLGADVPEELSEWTVDRLPTGVRLWVERYGEGALLSDFPGTKLGHLLQDQLRSRDKGWQRRRRKDLLPLHRPPRIIHVSRGAGLGKRLRGELYQARFVAFRARFHVVEGLRYIVEAARWRRLMAADQALIPLKHSEKLGQMSSGRL